ncbi:23S rRNA methyltransferase [Neisseria arctica]|uniref:23S rRNA methyltransferase n=1 Tax=Neisseria arctica TaxID=1470200 RepID=A0A0J1C3W1_9NEIS|nr:23S rRNA methyltransferase [Neisseria arctica]
MLLDYSLLIILLALLLLVLLFVRHKQNKAANGGVKSAKGAAPKRQSIQPQSKETGDEWLETIHQTVEETNEQEWEWEGSSAEGLTTSVSAQEVDPLTEYQVYKQFGYEDKAAASLAGYLNHLDEEAPEKLVHELVGLSLRAGNFDLLAETLGRHRNALSQDSMAEYIKAGLIAESTHLPLRVLAERELGWGMQEVSRQIGEQTGLEEITQPALTIGVNKQATEGYSKRIPIVTGNLDVGNVSEEELGAVMGFVRPDKSAKILKNKVDYETALQQYNRAIQKSEKPASLIIDALRLDYQHEEVGQFAKHLWRLYYSLGQYGRQVKERMLGWGYSLGYHEVFDDLEKGPNEQQVREIGLAKGYLQPSARQMKAHYRDLVQKDTSLISENATPAEQAVKEVESLLMYGQLDQAIGMLEQAVLQYSQESQLYIMLFDLYERSEDWVRLEQFLRILKERVDSLPEEVVLAMSQLLQRVNQRNK